MIINKENYSIEKFIEKPCTTDYAIKDGTHRYDHLKHAVSQISIEGEILEFGVFSGASINLLASQLTAEIIHGFDSFEGLPESWFMTNQELQTEHAKRHKGYFKVDSLPTVLPNVKLWKGWFDQTIPKYIEEIQPYQIKFLHVDCDLYSSTKTIFDKLNRYIVAGTIIVFDEFYPFSNFNRYELWAEHEYKALKEWIEEYDREFEIVGRSGHQQCSIRIIK